MQVNVDNGNDPGFHIPLDMDRVARAALGLRLWELRFDVDGHEFVWTGEAGNESAAETQARHALMLREPMFSRDAARLVQCIER